jgi:hypothetical protein
VKILSSKPVVVRIIDTFIVADLVVVARIRGKGILLDVKVKPLDVLDVENRDVVAIRLDPERLALLEDRSDDCNRRPVVAVVRRGQAHVRDAQLRWAKFIYERTHDAA